MSYKKLLDLDVTIFGSYKPKQLIQRSHDHTTPPTSTLMPHLGSHMTTLPHGSCLDHFIFHLESNLHSKVYEISHPLHLFILHVARGQGRGAWREGEGRKENEGEEGREREEKRERSKLVRQLMLAAMSASYCVYPCTLCTHKIVRSLKQNIQ